MQALYETKNYVVVVGKYPEWDEYPDTNCYWVQNKQTLVVEYYVNSLPKAVYLAQESDSTLDKLMKGDDPSLAQLHLLVSDDNVH